MQLNDPSLLKSKNYVNGEWVGDPVTPVLNPATGEELAKVPYFGADETRDAIAKADVAFKSWRAELASTRAKCLRRWYDLLVEHADDIATIMTSEQGKPLAEAKGEALYAASFLEYYAEEARRINGETIPSHRTDSRIVVIKQPIGVAAAITPWNFPAGMITRKVAPAVAAGCSVVIKPAGETPLTALALAELADRAGFPKGVINIITGKSSAIGEEMTSNPTVRVVGFTGSTEIGKLLMRQCASTVKRVGLELGGNAPFIVFDDANLDDAVEGAMISKFRNMGQTCICANRIYVQDGIYDAFAEKFAGEVAKLKVGNGLEVGVTQGPLISEDAVNKVESHIQDAVGQGAELLMGGNRHDLGGTFFQPTVLKNVTTKMLVSREETFGPLAALFRFKDEDDVIQMANDTEFGLASYFYARDLGRVWRVAEALEYGMVGVNAALLSTAEIPFGGVKESGLGREGSHYGIDEFVEIKYILMSGIDK